MNCPAMPPGGGRGMKFRKPFSPIIRKITPARYRAITETVLITMFSFSNRCQLHGVNYIEVNRIDAIYFWRDAGFLNDPGTSRYGPCLGGNDEGDARPDQVRNGWY